MKRFLLLLGTLLVVSSCSKLLGNLRRDLSDPDEAEPMTQALEEPPSDPVVGGAWAERGYLGHSERNPASSGFIGRPPAGSWVTPEAAEANRRDIYRGNPDESMDPPSVSSATVSRLEPEKKMLYKRGPRATRDDFVDQSQEEGSLWASSGQTNYYFIKNKVRSPGDLISLVIDADLYRDIGMEVKRTLSPSEKEKELAVIQNQLRTKFLADLDATRKDSVTSSAAAPERAPAQTTETQAQPSGTPAAVQGPAAAPVSSPGVGATSNLPAMLAQLPPEEVERFIPRASFSDVDIYPSLDFKAGDTMMGEIIERFPNGNFKIRTMKRIPYKKGPPRLVSVVGIVKSGDINEETDVIASGKLFEYRVEVAH